MGIPGGSVLVVVDVVVSTAVLVVVVTHPAFGLQQPRHAAASPRHSDRAPTKL
jgi:hypothetical protein